MYGLEAPDSMTRKASAKAISAVSLVLLIQMAMQVVLAAIGGVYSIAVSGLLPGNAADAEAVLEAVSGLQSQLMNILIYSLSMSVPFLIFLKMRGGMVLDILRARGRVPAGEAAAALFVTLAVGYGVTQAITFAEGALWNVGVGVEYYAQDLPPTAWGLILFILSYAVLPAILEEFAFRGVLLEALSGFGPGFGILASSLLFGLVHGTFQQIPFAFAMGLCLGYVYVRYRNFWLCAAIHFANNLLSILLEALYVFFGYGAWITGAILTDVVIFGLAIVFLVRCLARRKSRLLPEGFPGDRAPFRTLVKGFGTPAFVVLAVICGILVLTQFYLV